MPKLSFKYDIVHTEKYEDRQTGEERKKHTKLGAVFERDDGSLCAKILDSWVNFYPPKERRQSSHNQSKSNGFQTDDMMDDIPFN